MKTQLTTISWQEFERVDIRIGTITAVQAFPEAEKPAYKLTIDLGKIGTCRSSAQLTDLYSREELLGKQVVCVVNFPPKQIGPFISECLVTGFYRPGGEVVLAVPDKEVPNGARLG